MSLPRPTRRFTPQEYYELERSAVYKSDFYDGEVFDTSGGTSRHSDITANITGSLWGRLRGKPRRVAESNQRLKIQTTGLRCYPDVSVYCGPRKYDEEDCFAETAINPTVLLEVLSPGTESYDRGLKSESYRRIESLQAYVLVAQDWAHVELYERQPEGAWRLTEKSDLQASVAIPCIAVELPLAEIFDRVEFVPSDIPPRPDLPRSQV
jgi:Uma2 family endonuclease